MPLTRASQFGAAFNVGIMSAVFIGKKGEPA
jgi:hypothetical protein